MVIGWGIWGIVWILSDVNPFAFFYICLFSEKKLKADRPHPHDYSTHRQTPWTDNESSLLFAALGKQSP